VPAIASRTEVGYVNVILALASGVAGTLAFTSGFSGAVIGVMVAVALVPPTVTAGLLVGAGHFRLGLGAAHLAAVNVICVNLAGVATFLAQGVRPRRWWEADRAKRASRRAIAVWAVLLLALVLGLAL